MSDAQATAETSLSPDESASRVRGGTVFLLTPSEEPCGVEVFTRSIVAQLDAGDSGAGYELLAVSGRWRDLPRLLGRVARADRVVFSFPLVAWKRMLIIPVVVALFAVATRRPIGVFLHEWNALHRLRRLQCMPFVALGDVIVVLSPFVRDQLASDPWVGRMAKKCRLVPHPPTIIRPARRIVTERVRQIRHVAETCDVVIGCFGSLYSGKAPAALLEVCDHLRRRGIRALVVFIGDFIKSLDNYEGQFRARVRELALEDRVIVTGYVGSEEELFALFECIGAFLFLFPEGLTARRSSVITCLQSHRPVVVSAPLSSDEFRHHAGLTALIEAGALSFVSRSAAMSEIADQLLAVARRRAAFAADLDAEAWWSATTAATNAAFRPS